MMYRPWPDCFSKARQAENAPATEAEVGTVPWNTSVPWVLVGR